jgi:hypothetical protein
MAWNQRSAVTMASHFRLTGAHVVNKGMSFGQTIPSPDPAPGPRDASMYFTISRPHMSKNARHGIEVDPYITETDS